MTKQTQSVAQLTAAMIRVLEANQARVKQMADFAAMKKAEKEARSGRYADAFKLAQSAGLLADFEQASDAAKAAIKASKGTIDRDVSNAVSQIKRFWRIILEAVEARGAVEVTVRSVHYKFTDKLDIIGKVETLNSLREVAEEVKGQGAVGADVLVKKLTLLQSKVKAADPAQANAALDAALAFFLAGKAPRKAPKQENSKVTAKAKRPAKVPAAQQA